MNKKMDKKKEIARMAQAALLLLSTGAAYGMNPHVVDGDAVNPDEFVIPPYQDFGAPENELGLLPIEFMAPGNGCGFPEGGAWAGDRNVWEQLPAVQNTRDGSFLDQDGQVYSENDQYGQAEGKEWKESYYNIVAPEGDKDYGISLSDIRTLDSWFDFDTRKAEEAKVAAERQRIQKETEWQERQEREQECEVPIVEPMMVPRGARPYQCGSCAHSFQYELSLYNHEYNKHGMWRSVPFSPQYGQQLAFMNQQWWGMQAHAAAQSQESATHQNKVNKTRRFRCNKCTPNRTFLSAHNHAVHMEEHAAQEEQARRNF
jgi:DNA-binding transcriptional MerR regulator